MIQLLMMSYFKLVTVHRRDRNRNGGGVALYVHHSLTPSLLDVDGEVESVWVSITTHGKKFIKL